MMTMNLKLLLLLNTLFFLSCAGEKERVGSFSSVEKINDFDVIFSDSESPLGVVPCMDIVGNVLVMEHAMDSCQYSFVDVSEKKMLCRWGSIGEGPNEFIDFGSRFFLKDSLLVFSSFAKKELNVVSLSDILNPDVVPGVKKEPYPYVRDFRPLKICPMDSIKIAVGSFAEGFVGILGQDNEIVGTFGDYPFSYSEVQGIFRGPVFQTLLTTCSSRKRFAVSFLASDIFEIFDASDSDIRCIYTSPFAKIPQIKEKGGRFAMDAEKSSAGLLKMVSSDQYIYFLYSELTYAEVSRRDYSSDEVLCFDWDGNKIKKYILPFPVSCICVGDGFLYGIRLIDDVMNVCRFKI